jgi:ABC-type multidrug transport system fused ATPase/permease subunit
MKKIFNLLDKKDKFKFIILFFLLLTLLLFEIFSISSIFPLLAYLINKETFEKYSLLVNLLNYFNLKDSNQIIIFFLSIIIIFFIFKSVLYLCTIFFQWKFIYNLQAKISNKLLKIYLLKEINFYYKNNTSLLIRNINIEVSLFILNYIHPILTIFAETIIIIGIGIFLFSINPLATVLVTFILVTFSLLLIKLTKSKTIFWSNIRHDQEGQRLKILQHTFGLIEELKILGRLKNSIEKFSKTSELISKSGTYQMFFIDTPRVFLELVAIIAFCTLILLLDTITKNGDSIIPVVGVFGAAAFRLLPTASRILLSLQRIRYAKVSANLIFGELDQSNNQTNLVNINKNKDKLNFSSKIQINNLSFFYGEKKILDRLNLEINKGEIVGIIGPSGKGKTTFLKVFMGLLMPNQGSIYCDGVDILKERDKWFNNLGYVPQHIFLTDDTIYNNVAISMNEEEIDFEKVNKCLEIAQLKSFVEQLPKTINTKVGERGVRLSGGQRQRIGIARALYNDPDILLFDEPTSSLDDETEIFFLEYLKSLKKEKTILIISHKMQTAKICDRFISI